jgi:hypothetical protein
MRMLPPAMLTRRAAAAAAVRTFPTGRTSEVAQLLPVPAAADDEPEVVIDWV